MASSRPAAEVGAGDPGRRLLTLRGPEVRRLREGEGECSKPGRSCFPACDMSKLKTSTLDPKLRPEVWCRSLPSQARDARSRSALSRYKFAKIVCPSLQAQRFLLHILGYRLHRGHRPRHRAGLECSFCAGKQKRAAMPGVKSFL